MGISTTGLDDLMQSMKELGELDNGELTENMLEAGAEVVAKEWKDGIKSVTRGSKRSTGDMADSVATSKDIKKLKDVSTKTIYPQGKDRKGVRNAEKAFILHYGKTTQLGTHFVDDVEEKAGGPSVDAMEQIFDEFITKKGF